MLLAMTGIADGHTHTRQAAQDSTKRVAILFPFDSAVIDSSFMNNSPALRLLDRIMSNLKITSQLDSIMVLHVHVCAW